MRFFFSQMSACIVVFAFGANFITAQVPISESTVWIVNSQTGLFLNENETRSAYKVTIENYTGLNDQMWILRPAGDSRKYHILNKATGKFLDIETNGSGARLITSGDNLKHIVWKLNPNISGAIINAQNNLAIDVDVVIMGKYEGSYLAVYPRTSTGTQMFNIRGTEHS